MNSRRLAHRALSVFVLPGFGALACSDPGTLPENDTTDTSQSVAADGSLEDYGLSCETEVRDGRFYLTLMNHSQVDAHLFAWNTTWDQHSDALNIATSGSSEPIEYRGPHLNRGRPGPKAWITIPSGGSASSEYAIDKWYAVAGAGQVDVSLRASTLSLEIDGVDYRLAHDCRPRGADFSAPSGAIRSVQEPLYPHSSCSAEQKERINRVIPEAVAMSRAALQNVGNRHDEIRWFGDTSGIEVLTFDLMARNPGEAIRCGGDPCDGNLGVVANYYLLGSKLYLCPALWEKPFTAGAGVSQVETLVHEMSHFFSSLWPVVDVESSVCNDPMYPGNGCYQYSNALLLAEYGSGASNNAENYSGFASEAYTRAALFGAVY